MPWLNQAVNRVEVITTDHQTYLQRQPDNSYDIVYFDPMFSRPVLHSQPISPLRKLANHDALDTTASGKLAGWPVKGWY